MKPSLVLLAFVLTSLLTGCDTLMFSQYRVTSVATAKEEEKKLLEVLSRVAARVGLREVTATSKVKETLVFYSEPGVEHSRVQLGARVVGDSIIVDLVGGFGPKTATFEKAEKALDEEFNRSFAGRYDRPSPRVPIQTPNQSLQPTALLGRG